MDIAARHDLKVIEDCAQCHGAMLNGKMTSTFGHMAAFSFYPTKNLGALGDGGGVVSNDPALIEKARLLREYGWRERYISELRGMNTRLDEIQAAILRVKLKHLETENQRRRDIAAMYDRALAGGRIATPQTAPGVTHVYHQYVVRSSQRDLLREHFKSNDIATLILYPVPIHEQPAYRGRVELAGGGLPNTESLAGQILSLPMHPQLTDDDVKRVIDAAQKFA
jgi:dTDP-4-amino-4,6-dideoxygalactose transaminase